MKYLFGMDGPSTEAAADVTGLIGFFGIGDGLTVILQWLLHRYEADTGCLLRLDHHNRAHVEGFYYRPPQR